RAVSVRDQRLPASVPGALGAAARDRGAGDPEAARHRGAWRDDGLLVAAHRGAHEPGARLAALADFSAQRELPRRAPPLCLGAAIPPAAAARGAEAPGRARWR